VAPLSWRKSILKYNSHEPLLITKHGLYINGSLKTLLDIKPYHQSYRKNGDGMIDSSFRPSHAIESEFSEMSEIMVRTPKEPPITNRPPVAKSDHEAVLHEAVLRDVDAFAEEAQSAPGLKSGDCMKKTWERIDRYWTALEKAHVQLEWPNDGDNKEKAELMRRLIENRDKARISARFIYQAAIDHLKRKPAPTRGRTPNSAVERLQTS
jgi:hypothetical protein